MTYHPFAPLNDRLLLRDVSTEEKELGDSGLERPETYRQRSHEGEVISVGEKVPGDVKPGDIVKFSEFGVETLKIDGHELLLTRYMDLKGVRRAHADQ